MSSVRVMLKTRDGLVHVVRGDLGQWDGTVDIENVWCFPGVKRGMITLHEAPTCFLCLHATRLMR